MAKHYYELEWNKDLKTIYNKFKYYWMCLPSILDNQRHIPRLPSIFEEIQESYVLVGVPPDKPKTIHKQSLHLDRITNPSKDICELLELIDKYNLRHHMDFFHQNPDTRWKITSCYMPHKHTPGGTRRKGVVSSVDSKKIIQQTDVSQLTFPFINSHLGETLWSRTYKGFDKIENRKEFTEEEISERYRLTDKPVLYDVLTWHSGKNEVNNKDRIVIGIPTKFDSFEESIEFFLSRK